ncbi:MAG TPA: hypothetical protein VM889_06695 [Candidatus Thermoplasmatota archaeon]|nr:hypothetical protein [Candidatus Thermoplasmatota archaeon]
MLANLKAFLGSKGNVILLAGLMLLPGTVLGAQYGFYAGVPTLEMGERWDYETRTEGLMRVPRVEMPMDMTMEPGSPPAIMSASTTWVEQPIDEKGAMTLRVIDTAAEVAGIPTYRLWTRSNGYTHESDITRADLNPIVVKRMSATDGKATNVEAEELPLYRFPLHAGKSWTYDAPDEKVVVTFTVLDRDFRSFKGSMVEAYHIRGSVALDEAEYRKAQEEGLERAHFALDYWYAPAVHGLLEVVFSMDLSIRDGFAINLRHSMTLVDHRLDPLSPAEVAVLRHGLAVSGPDAVNLAEGTEGRYKVTLGDGAPIPDGVEVAWRLNGAPIGARGPEATVAFADVAMHHVEAAIESRGDDFMSASRGVEASYEKVFSTPANPLGVKATFEFPVGAIPANLAVRYRVPTCLALCGANRDEVKLLDGAGNAIPANRGGGAWELNTAGHAPGTWKVVLDLGPARSLTDDVEVRVAQSPSSPFVRVSAQTDVRGSLFAETLGWTVAPPRAPAGAGVVPGALAALGVDA